MNGKIVLAPRSFDFVERSECFRAPPVNCCVGCGHWEDGPLAFEADIGTPRKPKPVTLYRRICAKCGAPWVRR